MPSRIAEVDTFLAELKHPLKESIKSLRAAILRSNAAITEHIKWNAPSFCHAGDDRVTFRLPPKGGLQLIFHRGAKVKDVTGFSFEDRSGLIAWAAPDRGVVTLKDAAEVRARTPALTKLVNIWMSATAAPSPARPSRKPPTPAEQRRAPVRGAKVGGKAAQASPSKKRRKTKPA